MVTQHPTNTTPQTFLSLYKKQGPQTTRAARSGRQRIGILFKRATYDHCPQAVGTARPRSAVSVPWRDSRIMCAIPGGSSPPWPDKCRAECLLRIFRATACKAERLQEYSCRRSRSVSQMLGNTGANQIVGTSRLEFWSLGILKWDLGGPGCGRVLPGTAQSRCLSSSVETTADRLENHVLSDITPSSPEYPMLTEDRS